MKSIDVLLLSREDIPSLELAPLEVVEVVEAAPAEHAAGIYEMHPKIGAHPTGTDPADFIHAMPAYLKQLGVCGLKWVAGFANNYQRDPADVSGLQIYNDTATGVVCPSPRSIPTANAHTWGSCVDLRDAPCRSTPCTPVPTVFPRRGSCGDATV